MRIENPAPLQSLDFPINTEDRAEIYQQLGGPIYKALEQSRLGTATIQVSGLTKRSIELIRSGVRYHIIKDAGDPRYPLFTTILSNPKDRSQHVVVFSKKPWEEIVWGEVMSKLE
jgi:hypothetical protein